LFSSTVVGGFVVRDAGASELSAEAAAMKNVSNSVAGLGLMADADAVAAATADRGAARSSRDSARGVGGATALTPEQQAAADKAEAEAAAVLEAETKAKAEEAKAKAAAEAKAKAEALAKAKAQRWVKPFSNYTLTSGFGWRWGRMHPAQDLAAPTGTPVYALSTGRVIFAGWSNEGYGYMVRIRYWDGTVSWYAHNSRLLVSVGDTVTPGQKVSYSGNTGNSTGPHLHLEIHPDGGAAVAPKTWLAKRGIYL
jgi:murein DD-endopeptidase MepM/ murein hydrolase activator NlpD